MQEKTQKEAPLYDVAIIGMGPVGCTAAILFAEAGLNVVAVERDKEVYKLPRAVNLDGEIIRAFQKVGRGQTVQNLMQPIRPGDRAGFANSKREWLFGQESKDFGKNGWQPMNMFDQPELESYLRREACEHTRVTSFIGFEASLTQNGEHVVGIEVQENGRETSESITAQYLVACDGAASPVRKSLNIGWHDLGYDHRWLVVDITTKDGHTLTNDTLQVCDPDRIHTYVCTKDPYRRWEFKLHDHETAEEMLDPEKTMSLIDPWTPRGTYEIRRSAVYQFHAANAERWREGRVFIAGDAAHQTPPFLGQGMNTGMRDVINLSWKLPMVINGQAQDTLLDTYHAERDAHAHDLVDWATAIGRLMEHTADQERCAHADLPPPKTPEQLKSAGYGQGREQPPIRDGVIFLEQVTDNSGSVGHLLSQPIVRRLSGGEEFRFDQLLGTGFTVVVRHADEITLSASAQDILTILDAPLIDLSELECVRGRFDRLFDEHAAAIVRPDRLVFGTSSDDIGLDDLIEALAEKLSLTN